jgi:hypothetical protein
MDIEKLRDALQYIISLVPPPEPDGADDETLSADEWEKRCDEHEAKVDAFKQSVRDLSPEIGDLFGKRYNPGGPTGAFRALWDMVDIYDDVRNVRELEALAAKAAEFGLYLIPRGRKRYTPINERMRPELRELHHQAHSLGYLLTTTKPKPVVLKPQPEPDPEPEGDDDQPDNVVKLRA